MKVLKKFKWIFIGFAILFLFIAVWIGKDFFKAQYGALYGNRLVGIDDVPITNEDINTIKDFLMETEGVTKVKVNVHGIIIYITILVDENITIEKVKEILDGAAQKLSAEQKGFYDVSFLVNYAEESKKTDFPIAGYKNNNSDEIVW